MFKSDWGVTVKLLTSTIGNFKDMSVFNLCCNTIKVSSLICSNNN